MRCFITRSFLSLIAAGLLGGQANAAPREPDVTSAMDWWAPPRGVWTPLGWPDHLFRFQSVYNGALICAPAGWMGKPHIEKYRGQDFALTFSPGPKGDLPPMPREPIKLYKMDGGFGQQGWREDKIAPVLWTDWPCQEGVVMRQEVFTVIDGARDVESGIEPLYAWIRLSVAHVDPLRAPETFSFGVQLSKVFYDSTSTIEDSLFFLVRPDKCSMGPGALKSKPIPASAGGKGQGGLEIQLADGRTRMLVLPGGDGKISFKETSENSGVYHLTVELPVKAGAATYLLVPMIPSAAEAVNQQASHGFDGAMELAERYWTGKTPATAARIHTPEPYINRAIARNLQLAQIIAERNPETGEYAFLSGSYGYDTLWSTPTSMISHMFLDLLGYHNVVEKHIRLYQPHQGSVKPPGDAYALHPGYLSTPKSLTAIDWLSDHGAILEILSRHALLTGDPQFTSEWLDTILKGCDFIKDSSASTNHSGVKGLLPPGIATDSGVPSQAIWNQAWNYKGLTTSIRLLKRLNHPRAGEFESFAKQFRRKFNDAFLAETAKAPKWTAPDGRSWPVLPSNLIPAPSWHIFDDPFLLDTGPLCLPWAGLFDASDPLMVSFGDFFRVGPNQRLRGPQTSAISRATLRHEIASCEPCYSWNIANSWLTADREKFLEGMYSLFTGAISPQTYINCEHRNAMYGNVFVAPLMTWCLRQAVIDDQIVPGELHLLRLVPQAWLSSKEKTVFENMPTEFGPVSLRFARNASGHTLDVEFSAKWRSQRPEKIILHKPELEGLKQVRLNGKTLSARRQWEIKGL
ncbi:MAG TPA: hypothetical protein VN673_12640 [Clostridia bacterium]|nr:hypothetical protein [Clostridia bacterium]